MSIYRYYEEPPVVPLVISLPPNNLSRPIMPWQYAYGGFPEQNNNSIVILILVVLILFVIQKFM